MLFINFELGTHFREIKLEILGANLQIYEMRVRIFVRIHYNPLYNHQNPLNLTLRIYVGRYECYNGIRDSALN